MRAQGLGPTTLTISERLRLESERDQAAALGNLELAAQLTRQLEQASGAVFKTDSLMSELNERNRKANREEIRRAELAASELRRQQMKALEAGAAVKLDPSARVKINPRLTYEARSVINTLAIQYVILFFPYEYLTDLKLICESHENKVVNSFTGYKAFGQRNS
jgi:RNA polymerase-associated protein RTF1